MEETNEELIARHQRVQEKYQQAVRSRDRTKSRPARDQKSRWAGSLNFTLLSIESEMRDRGLLND
jgi:hypothetical protein